jgi:hypothetical protein
MHNTTGYAQSPKNYLADNPAAAPRPAPELDQIEARIQRIAELVNGNHSECFAFVSRVAPWLHAPSDKAQTGQGIGDGACARINALLDGIDNSLADLSRVTSYLGRIG